MLSRNQKKILKKKTTASLKVPIFGASKVSKKCSKILSCYHQMSQDEVDMNFTLGFKMFPCQVCPICKRIKGEIKKSKAKIKFEYWNESQLNDDYEDESALLSEELKRHPPLIPIKGFEYVDEIDFRRVGIGTCKLPLPLSEFISDQNSNDKLLLIRFVNKEFQRILSETIIDLKIFDGGKVEVSSFFQVHDEVVLAEDKTQANLIHIHFMLLPIFQRKNEYSIDLIESWSTDKYEKILLKNWYKFISVELSKRLKLYKNRNKKSFLNVIHFPQSLTKDLVKVSAELDSKEPETKRLFWVSRLKDKRHLFNYIAYINKFSMHDLVDFYEKEVDGKRKIVATIRKSEKYFIGYIFDEDIFFNLLFESHGGKGYWIRRVSTGVFNLFNAKYRSKGVELILKLLKDGGFNPRVKEGLMFLIKIKMLKKLTLNVHSKLLQE